MDWKFLLAGDSLVKSCHWPGVPRGWSKIPMIKILEFSPHRSDGVGVMKRSHSLFFEAPFEFALVFMEGEGGGREGQWERRERGYKSSRFFRMSFLTSAVTWGLISSTDTVGSQAPTTFPSGATRYFQKFQVGSFPEVSRTKGRRRAECASLGTLPWNSTFIVHSSLEAVVLFIRINCRVLNILMPGPPP